MTLPLQRCAQALQVIPGGAVRGQPLDQHLENPATGQGDPRTLRPRGIAVAQGRDGAFERPALQPLEKVLLHAATGQRADMRTIAARRQQGPRLAGRGTERGQYRTQPHLLPRARPRQRLLDNLQVQMLHIKRSNPARWASVHEKRGCQTAEDPHYAGLHRRAEGARSR